jgi:hypothetical protein
MIDMVSGWCENPTNVPCELTCGKRISREDAKKDRLGAQRFQTSFGITESQIGESALRAGPTSSRLRLFARTKNLEFAAIPGYFGSGRGAEITQRGEGVNLREEPHLTELLATRHYGRIFTGC